MSIVAVTFEDDLSSGAYVRETSLPWPLIIDESRELYRSYGMLSASFWDVWGPKTWLAYLREFMRGRKPVKSEGDIMQRGGDVLIDPSGIVRMHHVGRGPADRPRVERILELIERWEQKQPVE